MTNTQVESLCLQGKQALRSRDHASAHEAFEEALSFDPDCLEAHEGMATRAFLDGDLELAVKHYTRLTMLKPLEARYHTNLGAVFNRMGEHQKACEALRKAIQRDKKCADAYYNLGIAQRKLKQNAMAISAYKEAIRLQPTMAEAYQNLGNAYYDMGNVQLAITNFKKALEIKPNFSKALNGLQAAEAQLSQSKSTFNPFGRLVESPSSSGTPVLTEVRKLTDEERAEERARVKLLSEEIERLGKACLEFLKQKLEPLVGDVERAMAQYNTETAYVLAEASESFSEAVVQWGALRRSLKSKIVELREHEEFMCRP